MYLDAFQAAYLVFVSLGALSNLAMVDTIENGDPLKTSSQNIHVPLLPDNKTAAANTTETMPMFQNSTPSTIGALGNTLIDEKGGKNFQQYTKNENYTQTTNLPMLTDSAIWCITDPPSPEMNTDIVFNLKDSPSKCQLRFTAPDGKIIKLAITHYRNAAFGMWQYDKGKRLYPELLSCIPDCTFQYHDVYSWTNEVEIVMETTSSKSMLNMRYTALNKSEAPRMEVSHLSPSLGYIQTQPRGKGIALPPLLLLCATIVPPIDHVIFVSNKGNVLKSDCDVIVFAGQCGQPLDNGKSIKDPLKRKMGVIFPDYIVYQSKTDYYSIQDLYQDRSVPMSLFYQVDNSDNDVGFSFGFSFHHNDSKPQLIGRSLHTSGWHWNCSVSVWPELYQLFPCDHEAQCAGSEDEANCPYGIQRCGAQQIEAGGKCFSYRDGAYLWSQSAEICRQQDASLPSLETPPIWHDFLAALERIADFLLTPKKAWVDIQRIGNKKDIQDLYIWNMYMDTWEWGSGSIAYYFHGSFGQRKDGITYGIILTQYSARPFVELSIAIELQSKLRKAMVFCEKPSEESYSGRIVMESKSDRTVSPIPLVACPMQHVTQVMMACDPRSVCSGSLESRGMSYTVMCVVSSLKTSPYFSCKLTSEYVPYSLVCDWRQDCSDNSDESFCEYRLCEENSFDCGHGQCIKGTQYCDGIIHCWTKSDEKNCPADFDKRIHFNVTAPPAIVNFDRPGSFTLIPLPGNTTQCPDTHFQCPGDGYCLPVYTRCNGINDCPGHEDEDKCDRYTCPGFYRCFGNDRTICVHIKHLCDGLPHCPRHDDELMCTITKHCPDKCICYGTAFSDNYIFNADNLPPLRHLEGRGSGLTMDDLVRHTMLIHLGAGACGWRNLSQMNLPNLHILDLSDNLLHHIKLDHFSQLQNLQELVLAGNPLSLTSSSSSNKLLSLFLLNLSRVPIIISNLHVLSDFMPRTQILDLSHSGFASMKGRHMFGSLKVFDLRGCRISDFSSEFMEGMTDLQQVFGDNFKVCCPAVLPDSFLGKCIPPVDEISSCDNLLKSGFYLAALIFFAMAALFGNLGSFIYRLWFFSGKRKVGFAVFVIHLSVSDFLMGIYLLIIGVTDRIYAGIYLWKESLWKTSLTCTIAGFISFVSCEVSSFIICLITLDRFMVIHFPFSRLRFGTTSANVACALTWGLGVILALAPLLPVTSHWAFYSQTGICIPLPVTRTDFPGRHYSFAVMIVVNLFVFLLIAAGQALIYWTIRASTMSDGVSKSKDNVISNDRSRSKEATIARRLLIIAMSDFLCWFPVGVCGLLAKLDIAIPGEVNTALAIFVLPLNSALNPFLYTYSIVRERRRKQDEIKMQRFVTAHLKAEVAALRR